MWDTWGGRAVSAACWREACPPPDPGWIARWSPPAAGPPSTQPPLAAPPPAPPLPPPAPPPRPPGGGRGRRGSPAWRGRGSRRSLRPVGSLSCGHAHPAMLPASLCASCEQGRYYQHCAAVNFLPIRLNESNYDVRLPTSVGDPDLHVIMPPGSASICQRYGSGSGCFPFLIKVLSGLNNACKIKF